MKSFVITVGVLALALAVAEWSPFVGALVATFPVKIVALASARGTAVQSGLLVGAIASLAAVITLSVLWNYGYDSRTALIGAVVVWGLAAIIGRSFI